MDTIKAIRRLDKAYQEKLQLKTKRKIDLKLDHDYDMKYCFNITVRECIMCLANDCYLIDEIEDKALEILKEYVADLERIVS